MKEPKVLTDLKIAEISVEYRHASSRLILLDYDGTLVDFNIHPDKVIPDKKVLNIISKLASDHKNTVAIITGRDHRYLSKWFDHENVFILAEHGAMVKEPGKDWTHPSKEENDWKIKIGRIMQAFTNTSEGSLLEEKTISMVWHYRNVDPEISSIKTEGLIRLLRENITPEMNLKISIGKKIIEVKKNGYNKGAASKKMIELKNYSFILAIGDDATDEDMFSILPPYSYTFKVGHGLSNAHMILERPKEAVNLLTILVN